MHINLERLYIASQPRAARPPSLDLSSKDTSINKIYFLLTNLKFHRKVNQD